MKLYYYCSACGKENSFKTKATNRFELQEERGNDISERCKNCGKITKRHINRVHAKSRKWYLVLGSVTGAITTLILVSVIPIFYVVFVFSSIFAIPFLAWRAEENKASRFNKVMVDDK